MCLVLHLSSFKNKFDGGGIFPPNGIVALLETVSKLPYQKSSIIIQMMPSCTYCTLHTRVVCMPERTG